MVPATTSIWPRPTSSPRSSRRSRMPRTRARARSRSGGRDSRPGVPLRRRRRPRDRARHRALRQRGVGEGRRGLRDPDPRPRGAHLPADGVPRLGALERHYAGRPIPPPLPGHVARGAPAGPTGSRSRVSPRDGRSRCARSRWRSLDSIRSPRSRAQSPSARCPGRRARGTSPATRPCEGSRQKALLGRVPGGRVKTGRRLTAVDD